METGHTDGPSLPWQKTLALEEEASMLLMRKVSVCVGWGVHKALVKEGDGEVGRAGFLWSGKKRRWRCRCGGEEGRYEVQRWENQIA